MEKYEISSGVLTAVVLEMGAEICSLCDAAGHEFVWKAGPAWPRHAPILFPIVGRLKNDQLRHGGKEYHLTQHGFARDRRFAWLTRRKTSCSLELRDDAETRTIYPFAFQLILAFEIAGMALRISCTVENPGDFVLPASVGMHPAFNWPLVPGAAKNAHRVVFAKEEPGPIFQVKGGLLQEATVPSPVRGRILTLNEALFDADALIFNPPCSQAARYEVPGGPGLDVSWEGFTTLGIWSRRGGDFLCIEPWLGYASPVGFDDEFAKKPGLMLLAPGESRTTTVTVRIGRAA